MTTPHTGPVPDLDPGADHRIYGPQFPDEHDLYRAQDRPLEADQAGCGEAEYQRLVLERQQTELAYLTGYDRQVCGFSQELHTQPGAECDRGLEAGA
jgi:hypothetical protein